MVLYILLILLKIITIVLPLFIAIAYLTLSERKIISAIQRRKGPNVTGIYGILQPLADGLKLFFKETIFPSQANKAIFIIAPLLTLALALMQWAVIPFGGNVGNVFASINLGVLYVYAMSSLGVYGIIIAGWSSNSKYAFLACLRSVAQMISYEVCMGLILVSIIMATGTLNLANIVLVQELSLWFIIPFFPLFGMFFICCVAEANRTPFDLVEAEAELVSGYNVEYSALGYAMFFLGEYSNMLALSALNAIFFLGGWDVFNIFILNMLPSAIWLSIKTTFLVYIFVLVRAQLPRYRYDQLMRLGWKIFLPFALGWIVLIGGLFFGFNIVPFSYSTFFLY